MRTDFPHSSVSRPPRLDPVAMSGSDTHALAAHRKRPLQSDGSPSRLRSDGKRSGPVLIDSDEIAQGYGKVGVLGGGEGVEAKLVLEASDQDGKSKRIEPGLQQHKIVGERRQCLML